MMVTITKTMNVTKENFLEECQDFLEHLKKAAFVAIDEEMTGISVPTSDGRRPFMPKDDTPEERYLRIKGAAERYSIMQLGVTLFFQTPPQSVDVNVNVNVEETKQDEAKSKTKSKSSVTARIYNFHLFSSKREVIINPSTVEFLSVHGTDFNLWMKQGIPYVLSRHAQEAWSRFHERYNNENQNNVKSPSSVKKKKMEVTRSEDITFIARTMASLREWLDSASESATASTTASASATDNNNNNNSNSSFALPPCNSFRRRALYEIIESEYPTLLLEKGPSDNIVVHRLNPEEKIQFYKQKQQTHETKLKLYVGAYQIIEWLSKANQGLLSDHKIPIMVHNGLMDLLFILSHFHQPALPQHWEEAKEYIAKYFPILYDTKYIAKECDTGLDLDKTDLSTLYDKLTTSDTAENQPESNDNSGADDNNNNNTQNNNHAHDAGYDSFMTGCVFYELAQNILQNSRSNNDNNNNNDNAIKDESFWRALQEDMNHTKPNSFGRNKLNFMFTMYNIDLEAKKDPMARNMTPETTFRISEIDNALRTNDIQQRLHRSPHYEITWLDDTTFLVSSSQSNPLNIVEEENNEKAVSDRMYYEMKQAFAPYKVESLADYLSARHNEINRVKSNVNNHGDNENGVSEQSFSSYIVGGVMSLFGFTGKREQAQEGEPSKKRRRTEE